VIPSSRGAAALRALAAVAAAALIPVIAGCEAGSAAPTQHWHQPTPGASAVVDNAIRINNVFVLGPQPGAFLPAGGSAALFFGLANTGSPDRLVSVAAPGSAASVQLPNGGVSLAKNQSVLLTGPIPEVVLQHLTRRLGGGQYVRIVMNFLNAGRVTLLVPVMPKAQYYATYSPAPVSPSPSPSATLTGGKKGQATATPAPTPSATATATPAP
jgi:hypothetical protein